MNYGGSETAAPCNNLSVHAFPSSESIYQIPMRRSMTHSPIQLQLSHPKRL